jgi:hypothetical protein
MYSQVAVTEDDDNSLEEGITRVPQDHNDDLRVGIEMVGFVGDDDNDNDNNNNIKDDTDDSFHDEVVVVDDHDHESYRRNAAGVNSSSVRQEQFCSYVLEEQLLWNVWNRLEEPALLSITVTTFLLLPTLILWMYGAFAFVGRFWSIWIFVLLLQLRIFLSSWYIKSISTVSFKHRRSLRILCSLMTLLEVILLMAYHAIGKILMEAFFRDADGSIVSEWNKEVRFLRIATTMSWIVVLSRCCVGLPCMTVRTLKDIYPDTYREWRPTFWTPNGEESLSDSTRRKLYGIFRGFNILVLGVHIVCILSAASHFGPWPLYYALPEDCDPLDDHECALPFPSFHHMKEDSSSPTGWRVHLRGLPPLRGGIPFHPRFLNELDGFSTSQYYVLMFSQSFSIVHQPITLSSLQPIHFSGAIAFLSRWDEGSS